MRAHWICLTLALAARSAPVGAVNAVLNPDFDVDTNNWSEANPLPSTPGAIFVRSATSGSGSPLGAADLSYSRPSVPPSTTGDFDIWTNCMAVTGNTALVFGGQMNFVTHPAGSDSQVALFLYTSNDCTTGFSLHLATAGTTVPGTVDGVAADFTRFAGSLTTGASDQSMRMFLEINPGASDTPTRAVFDRVFVGPPGTTPVELLSFDVD